ncbi:MAG: hypothetical protein ACI8WY_003422 [Planctomycetota bacterium]|jgi:hypothetical protein
MKHLPLLAAPLALLTACSLSVEVESTGDEAKPVSTVAAAALSIGAGRWCAEQVFDEGDSNFETVTTVDGRRSGTWRLQFGEGIESVTYGFIGIGGRSRSSTSKLLGRTEIELTMDLEDINAEELLSALETFGADEERSIEVEASLTATAGVKATLTVSSDSGKVTSTGMLPGATRDAAVWPASSRSGTGSVIANRGEPRVLTSEVWGDAEGSRTSPRVSRAPGRVQGGSFEVSFELNGERQTFKESSTPAWVLFAVAD